MINKIERLVSVGKFRDYQATGPVNFQKLTLIYGDNGGGKTTLTSVLRSLTTNNPTIIRSRISTNHTAQQAAQISQVGTPIIYHTFGTRGWTSQLSDIEIFDIHFVNENIYSGFDFNEDHKKQLHQFVIGAQGIAIQTQIEQNKSAKSTSRQVLAELELQLFQQVGNNLNSDLLTAFLALTPQQASGIDGLITNAEGALRSANANATIQTLPSLSTITNINTELNFHAIISDLRTTLTTVHNVALQTLFINHCLDLNENSVESPEGWLQIGFNYLESKQSAGEQILACPFCKQPINNTLEILDAYANQFNEEFNSLINRLNLHLEALQNFNLDTSILTINNVDQINSGRIASWTGHLPTNVLAPVFNIIADENSLRTEFQGLISSVQQKLRNPSAVVDTTSINTFQNSLQTINRSIALYNQTVTTYNAAISTFRNSIQTIENAQLELDRLRRIRSRFEAPIIAICNQITTERGNLRNLENAYPTLIQQQQAAATTFFNTYQNRINYYLDIVFKTHFRIENVINVPPQGRATQSKIGYRLTIDGQNISFEPNLPFCAKECLSEGDKSTIALAFFLSKMDIDPNRQDKILVFDDPLSSLDTNRRTYTIGIIRSLIPQIRQVVVLSHNQYFLHEIGKDIVPADKKTLRITENFAANASIIELCDLEELVKNDYFKHIEALEDFRIHPNHAIKDTVLGWLRTVLESHLRFKFYREIRSMTGQKTFGRLISFLDTTGVVFRDNDNRATIIANLNLINSVSWMPHHGIPMPNYNTLGINPVSITAPELDNLIQDTLNLINNQL